MVSQACNLSSQEAEAGALLGVPGQTKLKTKTSKTKRNETKQNKKTLQINSEMTNNGFPSAFWKV